MTNTVSPMRILIVDDDPVLCEMFLDVMELSGHECEVARSGPEALERIGRQNFDLVISDLRMPEMTGQQLWERLQKLHPDLAESMIFISAEQPGAATSQFLESTGHMYLRKPFDIKDLLAVVQRSADRFGD